MDRAKESVTHPHMFDGDEDHRRKNFHRHGKTPKGHSGKRMVKKHHRGYRR